MHAVRCIVLEAFFLDSFTAVKSATIHFNSSSDGHFSSILSLLGCFGKGGDELPSSAKWQIRIVPSSKALFCFLVFVFWFLFFVFCFLVFVFWFLFFVFSF